MRTLHTRQGTYVCCPRMLTGKGAFAQQGKRFGVFSEPKAMHLLSLVSSLVSVSGRVVLWTHDQTSAFLGSSVDGLDDIDQLLLVLQHPVQLVVVSGSEIAHHVFVAEEEHDGHGIVQLVHLVEVGHLIQIADVDDCEVLDTVGDAVENFVLAHTVLVPVATEANDDQAVFFGHDGLIDVPAAGEMGEDDGTHGVWTSCGERKRSCGSVLEEECDRALARRRR